MIHGLLEILGCMGTWVAWSKSWVSPMGCVVWNIGVSHWFFWRRSKIRYNSKIWLRSKVILMRNLMWFIRVTQETTQITQLIKQTFLSTETKKLKIFLYKNSKTSSSFPNFSGQKLRRIQNPVKSLWFSFFWK